MSHQPDHRRRQTKTVRIPFSGPRTCTNAYSNRYDVLDVEPEVDENGMELVQEPYRAAQQFLQPIPAPGTPLPEFPKGKWVLALYPATTTFYRAEVSAMKKQHCRLRFEGEDEKDKEQDVDRRYVLDIK